MATNETFDKLIQDLTKDITVQVNAQVRGIIAELVRDQIQSLVTEETVKSVITTCVNQSIDRYKPDLSVFETRIASVGENINATMGQRAERLVIDLVAQKVNQTDVPNMVSQYVIKQLTRGSGNSFFPDGAIPGTAIDINTLNVPGDRITGGVIKRFASTGIDDQASSCQLTVMDQGTVFENTLYAPKMEVRGDLNVDGRLVIRGGMDSSSDAFRSIVQQTAQAVQDSIGPELLDKHQDRVFDRIRTEGVELGKLSIGGREIFDGRTMTAAIVNSQLETVGVLRDLQTQGESLFSGTLYTTQRRVGINTMDPSTALSIWDEEIELGIGKQQKDVGRIATKREHNLVLGSNGQDNLILTPDGSVTVKKIKIGNVMMGSSPTPPNYDAPRGIIMFNENPNLGGPLGWVSLGEARWANFGIID